MVKFIQVFFLSIILLGAGNFMFSGISYAQGVIAVDDDEEDNAPVKRYSEIKVWINKKVMPLRSEVQFRRNQRLNVKVERLKPYSHVIVKVRKAGTKLRQHKFLANHKGELELELTTPSKKLQGTADIIYYSSDGRKHQRRVKLIIS